MTIKKSRLFPDIALGYSGLSFVFLLLVIIAAYWRLYYSVEFTDEAFYVAIPYRFVLGDRLFIDEVNMAQTASLITFPFIRLYFWLVGSSDGIMLFTRHLYLVFNCLIACFIFWVVKLFFRWQVALFISLSAIAFIPFNIPNLSYNTLGSGFFTIGCLLGMRVILCNKEPRYLFFSGLFHGLTVLSYPSMLIPCISFIVILTFLVPTKRSRSFLSYCFGALMVAVFLTILVVNAGLDNVLVSFAYFSSFGVYGNSLVKISTNLIALWNNYPYKLLLVLTLSIIFLAVKIKSSLCGYVLLILPLFPIHLHGFGSYTSSLGYITYYSLIAPYLLLFIGKKRFMRQLFYGVWIPSFIAGMTTAWSSSNGYINTALGLFPGSLVTTVFLVESLLKFSSKKTFVHLNHYKLHSLAPILVVAILMGQQYSSVYRDDKIALLDSRVKHGPYKGLYTSREKNEYLVNLSQRINQFSKPGDRILFYDRFPAGYLFSSLKPATNTTWMFPGIPLRRQTTIDYYEKNNIEPDVVFRMKKIFYMKNVIEKLSYPENDLLNNFIEDSNYQIVLSSEDYTIFQKVNRQ